MFRTIIIKVVERDYLSFVFLLINNFQETTKRGLQNGDSKIAVGHCFTLTFCLDNGLRCLAPFMPKLAQHLHENLYLHPSVCREMHFPQVGPLT